MTPRHKMLIDALDRLEQCKYSPLDISWCIDTYIWMVKWKKIDAVVRAKEYCKRHPEYGHGGNYKFDSIQCVKKLKG